MPVRQDLILESFGPKTTVGTIVDAISKMLGGELWFRGEAAEFPVPANPVFARTKGLDSTPVEPDYDNGSFSFPLRVLTIGERDVIVDLQNNPPADPYFPALLNDDCPNHPGWIALARHHGKPTRLLDVTRDLLVALFFACSEQPSEDGFVFAYCELWNPERKNPGRVIDYLDLFDAAIGPKIPTYRDHNNSHPGTLDRYAKDLATEDRTARSEMAYLFECGDLINERMIAQRGAFVWRGDPVLPLFEGVNNVFAFRISSGAKADIEIQLNILGINSETLRIA